MALSSERERIAALRDKIRTYDAAYYGRGVSLVSDEEYDACYAELVRLEKEHPAFFSEDSPTARVGNDLTEGFPKVVHATPMMSIENTYSSDDVEAWLTRTRKLISADVPEIIGELKIDGIACSLRYKDGRLERAVTRGDGRVGDDITPNVRAIVSVPLKISCGGSLEVRGEIYMTFSRFQKLNASLTESGKKPMQNPRNTTAGTIKLLDPAEVARRGLDFAAYFLLARDHRQSHLHNLGFLQEQGFRVVPHSEKICTSGELIAFLNSVEEKRRDLDYPVDGVVLKLDSFTAQQECGATAKSPRWVIAYKYRPDIARTRVTAIELQVGRTGVITPVARLEPVSLGGTVIRNATLHNFDEIARVDVREGDMVEVEKGGEIIPKVIRVDKDKRPASAAPVEPPSVCPSCGARLVRLREEVALRCVNSACAAQRYASLNHFVSRQAMNIDTLGPALLAQVIERKWVQDPADLYLLRMEQWATCDHMGEKSARNVIDALQKSKSNPLWRLLHGLGIRMVGAQTARVLAARVGTVQDLYTMDEARLEEIETIGPLVAQSIVAFFTQEQNRKLIERLAGAGVSMRGEAGREEIEGPLAGKSVVLTGTLPNYTRDQARAIIARAGGHVTASVSKKTFCVVAGEDPGSKITRAQKLGIRILDEDGLLALIGGTTPTGRDTA